MSWKHASLKFKRPKTAWGHMPAVAAVQCVDTPGWRDTLGQTCDDLRRRGRCSEHDGGWLRQRYYKGASCCCDDAGHAPVPHVPPPSAMPLGKAPSRPPSIGSHPGQLVQRSLSEDVTTGDEDDTTELTILEAEELLLERLMHAPPPPRRPHTPWVGALKALPASWLDGGFGTFVDGYYWFCGGVAILIIRIMHLFLPLLGGEQLPFAGRLG